MERKIQMVANQVNMKDYDQSAKDMEYWLSKSPQERIAAVTFLISQNLSKGQKMIKEKTGQINFGK